MKERVVHVGSIPAAASLIVAGFEPVRIETSQDGARKTIAFPLAAQATLDSFYLAKRRIDELLHQAEAAR